MKRFLILAVCALLVLTVPAAALASTLTVWMPPYGTSDSLDKEFWEKQLAPFAAEKGIDQVVVEITPWDGYEQKYLTGVLSGNGPDVGYMYMEMISDFVDMGAVSPMDDYITDADRENYLYLDNGVFKGQQYMFPFIVGNPRIVIVNMDILADCGLDRAPRTWDELVEWGLAIKEKRPDVYPLLQGWGDTDVGTIVNLFYPFLWQAGGDIFNQEQTELALTSPEAVSAAQFLYDLRFTHGILPDVCTSLNGDDVMNSFLDGKVAMITTFTSKGSSEIEPAGMNWDYAVLSGAQKATFVACDSLVLMSGAKDQQLAADCIKYMTSGQVMTAFHKELSCFPPIAADEEYGDLERYRPMYEDPEIALHSLPAVGGMYMVNEALYKNIQLMLLGDLTPEEVMQQTQDYGLSVLKLG